MKKINLLLLFVFFIPLLSSGQEETVKPTVKTPKWTLQGYIKDMQTIWVMKDNHDWVIDNLIHNRLKFRYFAKKNITVAVDLRNRMLWGELVEMIPDYGKYIETDAGWADLSTNWVEDTSVIINSSIDRLYLDYSKGKWQVRVGRQRINWGQNLVWNPNDVFNAFSFFDFDYEEKPGMDGILLQYYPNYSSSVQLVYKAADSIEGMGWAGLCRFNKWGYDIQFLGGYVLEDAILGLGWSGDIKGAGFRGEATYFYPTSQLRSVDPQIVASISADYTLKSSWYFHAGFLYNSEGKTAHAGGQNLLLNNTISAKMLSPARFSILGQVSKPITPLFTADISGIYNPSDNSFYTGPAFTYSLSDNTEILFSSQLFFGDENTEFGDYGKLFFLRLKHGF